MCNQIFGKNKIKDFGKVTENINLLRITLISELCLSLS